MNETVYTEIRENNVGIIVLNKPERKNAIDGKMMDLLKEQLLMLNDNLDVNVIILKGEGDNFSSGGDLKQGGEKGFTINERRHLLKKYTRVVQTIQEISTPVIAMVDGYAVGGGMSLALSCDMIYASDRVKFLASFVKVGIVPEMGAMMFLPQVMGTYRAKELLFTGRMIGAEEAYQLGFVNKIFSSNELERKTLEYAEEIAQHSSTAIQITKSIINGTSSQMLNLVLESESTASPFCTQTEEFLSRNSLINKRKE